MQKLAANLQLNDEMMALHGKTVKRVFIARTPQVESNVIKLKIHPCCKRWMKSKLKSIKIAINHTVEVFDSRVNQAIDMRRFYQQEILSFLKSGHPLVLPADIKAFIVSRHGKVQTRNFDQALRGLKIIRKIIAAPYPDEKRHLAYRAPLVGLVGTPVIEHPGLHSQSLGWIVRWQENRQTQALEPVIRVILPSGETIERFSRDQHLNPVPRSFVPMWRQVAIAKEVFENPNQHPPIQIRADLLFRLQHSLKRDFRKYDSSPDSYGHVLLEIAKAIDFVPEHHQLWNIQNTAARDKTLDYLSRYYPGWRSGRFSA